MRGGVHAGPLRAAGGAAAQAPGWHEEVSGSHLLAWQFARLLHPVEKVAALFELASQSIVIAHFLYFDAPCGAGSKSSTSGRTCTFRYLVKRCEGEEPVLLLDAIEGRVPLHQPSRLRRARLSISGRRLRARCRRFQSGIAAIYSLAPARRRNPSRSAGCFALREERVFVTPFFTCGLLRGCCFGRCLPLCLSLSLLKLLAWLRQYRGGAFVFLSGFAGHLVAAHYLSKSTSVARRRAARDARIMLQAAGLHHPCGTVRLCSRPHLVDGALPSRSRRLLGRWTR